MFRYIQHLGTMRSSKLASRFRNIILFFGILSGILVCYFTLRLRKTHEDPTRFTRPSRPSAVSDTDVPILFIGGHPRSGTTLMRVLLDAHPSFHCGQETHIVPDLLALRNKYSHGRNLNRLKEAGLDLQPINIAIAKTIRDIIISRGASTSSRPCAKDPFTLKHTSYIARMFPNAQFILMVRDARAVIHSIRENKIKISRFPKTNSEAFRRWNKVLEIMFRDCLHVGHDRCKIVHYESLVLKPLLVLQEILRFLRTPWSDSVMNHTGYLDKAGGILLSK